MSDYLKDIEVKINPHKKTMLYAFYSKDNLKTLLENRKITLKQVYKELIILQEKDNNKFYIVTDWLRENHPIFFKRDFKELYEKAITSGEKDFDKLLTKYPLKDEDILLMVLRSKDHFLFLSSQQAKEEEVFDDTHQSFIKKVMNVYKEKNASPPRFFKPIEKYIQLSFNKYDYFYLRNIYEQYHPTKDALKIDIMWIRSKWDAYNNWSRNEGLTNEEKTVTEQIIMLNLDKHNNEPLKIKKLEDVASENEDFKLFFENIKEKIMLKQTLDNDLINKSPSSRKKI